MTSRSPTISTSPSTMTMICTASMLTLPNVIPDENEMKSAVL